MSAFVVSNETINRVVHLLDLDDECRPQHGGRVLGMPTNELGNQLWELNCRAVAHRYQEPTETTEPFSFNGLPGYTVFDLLKAARCWIYQCCEGEEFVAHPLMTAVCDKCRRIEHHIVTSMPAYEQAEWNPKEPPKAISLTATMSAKK